MTVRNGESLQTLLDEANAQVEVLTPAGLKEELGQEDLVLIDLRDIRELEREGHLPAAIHTPRGMLEFWIAPESPYARPIFQEDKRFVFYCQSGWRSALACAVAGRLGLERASHLEGGFTAWKKSGGEIVPYVKKSRSQGKSS